MKRGLVYCTYVGGIMEELGYFHRKEEWRLFINSSKLSLKTMLLRNRNMLPSIPVGYAAHIKETYENTSMKHICNKFPALSQTKLKKGIFVGPQIKKLLKDENFDPTLPETEKVACLFACLLKSGTEYRERVSTPGQTQTGL